MKNLFLQHQTAHREKNSPYGTNDVLMDISKMTVKSELASHFKRLCHEAFTGGQSLWRRTQRWLTNGRNLLAAGKSFHEAHVQDLVQYCGA